MGRRRGVLTCREGGAHDEEHAHGDALQGRGEPAAPPERGVDQLVLQRNQQEDEHGVEHGQPGGRELRREGRRAHVSAAPDSLRGGATPRPSPRVRLRSGKGSGPHETGLPGSAVVFTGRNRVQVLTDVDVTLENDPTNKKSLK